MAIGNVFSTALVGALLAVAWSAQPTLSAGLEDIEGRWVPTMKQEGFAGWIGPIEIVTCEPSKRVRCMRQIFQDGSCGTEIVPLMPAGEDALEGAYHVSLGVPESETDDDATQRLRDFRIERDGENLRLTVSPSYLELMMSRAALDTAVVSLERVGPPECPPVPSGLS